MTQGNKYLAHIVVKGLKGQFGSVLNWYHKIDETLDHLTAMILKEASAGSLALILPVLRPGLISRDEGIVIYAAKLIKRLGDWA